MTTTSGHTAEERGGADSDGMAPSARAPHAADTSGAAPRADAGPDAGGKGTTGSTNTVEVRVINGAGTKVAEPKSGLRMVWEVVHKRLLALIILALPIIQVFTGVRHPAANADRLRLLMPGLYFGCLALAMSFLTGAFVVKRRAVANAAGRAEAEKYDVAGTSSTTTVQMSRAAKVASAQQSVAEPEI